MSFSMSSQAKKEYIIPFIINIVAGACLYFFTKNILYVVLGVILLFAVIYIFRIISMHRLSGLIRCYNDCPDPTALLTQYFKKSKLIQILAIRGARMLGNDRSLINFVIKELPRGWDGKIQILILDPNSDHLRDRALELGHDPVNFAKECRNSIHNIVRLKENYGVSIEVRLYNEKPILRTIIFDDRALLSYYIGEEGHIQVQYELKPGDSSFFRLIKILFENLWSNSLEVSPMADDSQSNENSESDQ